MKINHEKLDGALGMLLDAYKNGEVDKLQATNTISDVIEAVSKENEQVVLTFFNAPIGYVKVPK